MTLFAIRCLAVVGLVCVLQSAIVAADVEHVDSWGNIDQGSSLSRFKTKIAIPFLTRETDVDYPGVSYNRFPAQVFCRVKRITKTSLCLLEQDFLTDEESAKDSVIVTGIKLVETAKDGCQPKAEITKGGIGQSFAQVKITSPSGCGIDAVTAFYIRKPTLFTKEIF